MTEKARPGRDTVEVMGRRWTRQPVKTHVVQLWEDYIELMESYIRPISEPGDVVSLSEKVIALCQGRVVTEAECRPGFWAKTLARCVRQTPAGPGMGEPRKMQFAINHCGLARVLWAALRAALDKLRGIHGTFYALLGREVAGLDGFYGRDITEYAHIGIRIPEDPDGVCDEIYGKTGLVTMIVDANDLGVELLGRCRALAGRERELLELIADNPAGQGRQLTPFVLLRPAE